MTCGNRCVRCGPVWICWSSAWARVELPAAPCAGGSIDCCRFGWLMPHRRLLGVGLSIRSPAPAVVFDLSGGLRTTAGVLLKGVFFFDSAEPERHRCRLSASIGVLRNSGVCRVSLQCCVRAFIGPTTCTPRHTQRVWRAKWECDRWHTDWVRLCCLLGRVPFDSLD